MPRPPRLRMTIAAVVLLAAGPAAAQFLPPGVLEEAADRVREAAEPSAAEPSAAAAPRAAGPQALTAAAGDPTAPHAELKALIATLEDDVGRERLLDHLRTTIGEAGAAAAAGGEAAPVDAAAPDGAMVADGATAADDATDPGTVAPPEPGAAPEPAPVGTRVADAIPELVERLGANLAETWRALRSAFVGLGALRQTDVAELRRVLLDLLPIALAALATTWVARRLMLPVFRRMGTAASRERPLHTAVIAVAAVLLDLGTILAGAAAGAVAIFGRGTDDDMMMELRVLFLFSFIAAGLLIVIIRAIFSPGTEMLRPLPIDDAGARYWTLRLGIPAAAVALSEIFVMGLFTDVASHAAGRAMLVIVYAVLTVYLVALVWTNRHAPVAYFERRAAETDDDLTFSLVSTMFRVWHWVVIGYLLAVAHQLITRGGGALHLVLVAAEIVAAFALGALLVALIGKLGERGVPLPHRLTRAMPMLEQRVNSFVPGFLRLLRLAVLGAWIAYALQVIGVLDLRGWLEARVGVDLLGALLSVLLIVLTGFLVWLALSSWIDYRLAPRRGVAATARERTLLSLLRNAAAVALLLIGIMFVLSSLGISIAPLLASAGVLGLAIGFGAQKMVEDIIGGVFIQFENAVNVGDVVSAAGITGVVEALTIRSVGLRDLQGVYHVIPFSAVSTVSNFTKGFGYHVADIGIAYRENVDEAKAEMLAAYDTLKADPEFGPKLIGDLEWFGVETLGNSAVTLRARLKTWPGDQWTIGRAFNEQVKKRFDAAGIEIPFPHLTVWFGEAKDGGAPPARVTLEADPPHRAPAREPAAPAAPRRGGLRPGAPTDAPEDGGGSAPDHGGEDGAR